MPDTRRHRGPHPSDEELFAPPQLVRLRRAVSDLSWLLSRGYASPSALTLVGDHYQLAARQRTAVGRSACGDDALAARLARRAPPHLLAGRPVAIDGYNLLITIESALAGGVILGGRDSTCRDLASMHGSYRTMSETVPALELIGAVLAELAVSAARWLLDSPVSNSGRLRGAMLALAGRRGWNWAVELHPSPDAVLRKGEELVISSDSAVLDECAAWANLACYIIDTRIPGAWVLDLAEPAAPV